MNESITFAEYSVAQKAEGKNLLLRILLISSYVLLSLGFFIFFTMVFKIVMLISILPLLIWILVFFTWRYVSYDYYFEFKSGTLEVGTIRGGAKGRKKSVLHTIHVKEAVYAARYGSVDELGTLDELCDYSSSVKEESRIAIVYEKDGKRVGVVLDSTTKLAGFIASYCPYAKELRGQKFIA
jgi:hypothetical protein